HFRKAIQNRPQDLATKFKLAQVVEKAAAPGSDAEYQKLMEEILQVQPNNLVVLVERGKIAAQRRDAAALNDTLGRFRKLASEWAPESRQKLAAVEAEAAKPLPGDVVIELGFLRNVLQGELGFNRSAIAVNPNTVGESLQQFVRLAPLRTTPDPPDTGLKFTPASLEGLAAEVAKDKWDVCLPAWLTGEGTPAAFVANAKTVRRADGPAPIIAFPSGPKQVPPTTSGVLAIDWNNDHRNDLFLAGAGGLKFWQQRPDGSFI